MQSSAHSEKLERELKEAQQIGRWLSDDERSVLEQQEKSELFLSQQRRNRRQRLIALTVVCILIPPLWGLAAGLSFYLLFPSTAKRVALVAGGGIALLTLLMTTLSAFIVLNFINLIF